MDVLTLEQIKAKYPNQWVLLANPELRNPNVNGTLASKLISAIVLLANKDKRELAYQSQNLTTEYFETACLFTGEIQKNRFILL
jgi:hypothetical protein